MPPPKTIFADRERIIASIYVESEACVAKLEDRIKRAYGFHRERLADDLVTAKAGWIRYDLRVFSGRSDLTESEKQIWRREVRQLQSEGLVERYCQEIRLTAEGKELVARADNS